MIFPIVSILTVYFLHFPAAIVLIFSLFCVVNIKTIYQLTSWTFYDNSILILRYLCSENLFDIIRLTNLLKQKQREMRRRKANQSSPLSSVRKYSTFYLLTLSHPDLFSVNC